MHCYNAMNNFILILTSLLSKFEKNMKKSVDKCKVDFESYEGYVKCDNTSLIIFQKESLL